MAAANSSVRKLAAAAARWHRSRARKDLHDDDEDVCMNEDGDDVDVDVDGASVFGVQLGHTYNRN